MAVEVGCIDTSFGKDGSKKRDEIVPSECVAVFINEKRVFGEYLVRFVSDISAHGFDRADVFVCLKDWNGNSETRWVCFRFFEQNCHRVWLDINISVT